MKGRERLGHAETAWPSRSTNECPSKSTAQLAFVVSVGTLPSHRRVQLGAWLAGSLPLARLRRRGAWSRGRLCVFDGESCLRSCGVTDDRRWREDELASVRGLLGAELELEVAVVAGGEGVGRGRERLAVEGGGDGAAAAFLAG